MKYSAKRARLLRVPAQDSSSALKMKTGILHVEGWDCNISQTDKPSKSGNIRSKRIMSGLTDLVVSLSVHGWGLAWYEQKKTGSDITFVIPNNGGGAIFSFLDQRDLPEFERLFTTPHGLDLGAICAASGTDHERVERMNDFDGALERARRAPGVRVVEVVIDLERNRRRHAEIQGAVDDAVDRTAGQRPDHG